ncbi:MAG TPA: hypothetical protein VNT79_01625 [Phycisphaerae bacterium]|nr:hypothetical protein [Phycisphaerae bacterium]
MSSPPDSAPRASVPYLRLAALGIAILALGVRVPLMTIRGNPADQRWFMEWSEISRPGSTIAPPGGLHKVYDFKPRSRHRWSNYPPGYILVLRVLAPVYDWIAPPGERLDKDLVARFRNSQDLACRRAWVLYKWPAVLADAAIAALLCVWIGRRARRAAGLTAGLLAALSPPLIFNSAVWGQVDSVFMLPMLISLERALSGRVVATAFWAALAILIKAQAIMLAPLWLAVGIVQAGRNWKTWLMVLAAAAAPTVLVLLPFYKTIDGLLAAYTHASFQYPYTHMNGFSGWFIVHPLVSPQMGRISEAYVSDLHMLGYGVTARVAGMIAVVISWITIIVFLIRRRCDGPSLRWAAKLLPLVFFCFSTQMHERYILPAIGLWLWAYARGGHWRACFALISIAAFFNVLWAWAGYGEMWWTNFWYDALHRTWLNYPSGQWCAIALLLVLVLTAASFPRRRVGGALEQGGLITGQGNR